ncbi:MAG TPA: protein-disulfide reductase DsbD N-terminal domain-containing protein [Gemmataceae bacterium]|nr:protein-disulfide reductase DsbD N-terminal domain-containing protein [Gemmataceae bacterium]
MRTLLSFACLSAAILVGTPPARAGNEPDDHHPVVASATLQPSTSHAGDTVTLIVNVKIAPGWHIYAKGSSGPEIVTTLNLATLPKGVTAKGEWKWPKPDAGEEGTKIYQGEVTFRHTFQLAADAPAGSLAIACDMGYQACNASACKPPAKLKLKATGAVK